MNSDLYGTACDYEELRIRKSSRRDFVSHTEQKHTAQLKKQLGYDYDKVQLRKS